MFEDILQLDGSCNEELFVFHGVEFEVLSTTMKLHRPESGMIYPYMISRSLFSSAPESCLSPAVDTVFKDNSGNVIEVDLKLLKERLPFFSTHMIMDID